jgi:photosystem II stability/assembly factor-like uncharacterized protein
MKIVSTPGLVLATATFVSPLHLSAQSWTPTSAPITNWTCVASSADGKKLIAGLTGPIYRSDDGGNSWVATGAPIARWISLASSGDGTILLAAADNFDGGLYISKDSGLSWTNTTPFAAGSILLGLKAVACSPDARVLAVGNDSSEGEGTASQMLISTNFGLSWMEHDLSAVYVRSVACSSDGNTFLAGSIDPTVAFAQTSLSTNSGVDWSDRYAVPGGFDSVACSLDGEKRVAVRGGVSISQDAGTTWMQVTNSNAQLGAFAMSADGVRMTIVLNQYLGSPIYSSYDSGATWEQADAPVTNWTSVACSADGRFFVATTTGGPIYVARSVPAPVLNLSSADATILISWLIPSMHFVLQQSSGLGGRWSDVPTTPVLNYTNLHYEVSQPKLTGTIFYRLAAR